MEETEEVEETEEMEEMEEMEEDRGAGSNIFQHVGVFLTGLVFCW